MREKGLFKAPQMISSVDLVLLFNMKTKRVFLELHPDPAVDKRSPLSSKSVPDIGCF